MRAVAVPSFLLAVSLADACCGIAPHDARVLFTGQTDLVVWDAARGVEHFVRDARFETKGGSLGFIAPTPGRPTLSEADGYAFDALEALKPKEPTKGETAGATGMDAAPGAVEVIETRDVAGYRATVLKANDAKALGAWLAANGYPSPAFLPRWVAPYVDRGWYLTAFKVEGAATGPVRMSFRTDRPFNPYAVPKENQSSGASLRLYYVSAGEEVPKVGGSESWRKPEWTADLPDAVRAQVAHAMRLEASAIPEHAHVSSYLDLEFGTPGQDDLYFVSESALPGRGATVAVGLVVVLVAARRVRAGKAS